MTLPTTPSLEPSDSPLSSTRTDNETDLLATDPSYSDSLKLTLIKSRKQEPTFHFPRTVYNRPSGEKRGKCQREWLDKYSYLAYSKRVLTVWHVLLVVCFLWRVHFELEMYSSGSHSANESMNVFSRQSGGGGGFQMPFLVSSLRRAGSIKNCHSFPESTVRCCSLA